MRIMLQNISAYFPERSLVIRAGSDTRYIVVKTWQQLTALVSIFSLLVWTAVASAGFSWNYWARVGVELELNETVISNQTFLAQLESDQKHAYELRQLYDTEVKKNEEWISRYQTIREFSADTLTELPPEEITAFLPWLKTSLKDEVKKNQVWDWHFQDIRDVTAQILNEETPHTASRFIPWLTDRLEVRVSAVEVSNSQLNRLVMDMSESVSEISGHSPPVSVQDAGPWLTNVAGDLSMAYETQSDAMELLHDAMTQALQAGFATIEETSLADPEFAGLAPSFGTGGPSNPDLSAKEHVFERFADRSKRLMKLSKDWQQLQQLLECAPLAPPVDYYNLTSKYGNRKDPFTKKPAWHQGVDLGAWPGSRVRATAPGVVTYSGNKGGYGRFILIDHGCGIETAYGHLKKTHVKKGQVLKYRDTIGEVGSTGRSTGPHVHYEIRIKGKPVDPYKFIEAGRYVFKEQKLTVAVAGEK